MTTPDPFELWKAERRQVPRSAALTDRVMRAVRRESTPRRTAVSFAGLAASVLLGVTVQAALVGVVLLALSGLAN
jgi:hypothetical protein